MNIFFVDENPAIAAKSLHNKHIHKMALEGSQLLANCYADDVLNDAPFTKKGTPWKHSHYNHPMAKWVRESKQNFEWSLSHTYELILEYGRRYAKNNSLANFLNWIIDNQNKNTIYIPELGFTPPPQCMPEHYRVNDSEYDNLTNLVRAYRNYYVGEKYHWFSEKRNKWYFNKWPSLEAIPDWFKNSFPQEQWKNFVK